MTAAEVQSRYVKTNLAPWGGRVLVYLDPQTEPIAQGCLRECIQQVAANAGAVLHAIIADATEQQQGRIAELEMAVNATKHRKRLGREVEELRSKPTGLKRGRYVADGDAMRRAEDKHLAALKAEDVALARLDATDSGASDKGPGDNATEPPLPDGG